MVNDPLDTRKDIIAFISTLSPDEVDKYGEYLTDFQEKYSSLRAFTRSTIHIDEAYSFAKPYNWLSQDYHDIKKYTKYIAGVFLSASALTYGGALELPSNADKLLYMATGFVVPVMAGLQIKHGYLKRSEDKKEVLTALDSVDFLERLNNEYCKFSYEFIDLVKYTTDMFKLKGRMNEKDKQIFDLSLKAVNEIIRYSEKLEDVIGKFEHRLVDNLHDRFGNADLSKRKGVSFNPEMLYHDEDNHSVLEGPMDLIVAYNQLKDAKDRIPDLETKRLSSTHRIRSFSKYFKAEIKHVEEINSTYSSKVSNIFDKAIEALSDSLGVSIKGRA